MHLAGFEPAMSLIRKEDYESPAFDPSAIDAIAPLIFLQGGIFFVSIKKALKS